MAQRQFDGKQGGEVIKLGCSGGNFFGQRLASSLTRELLCPLLVEMGAIARSRLAGISSPYAEIRRRRKRANLNKETANEFSRQAASATLITDQFFLIRAKEKVG